LFLNLGDFEAEVIEGIWAVEIARQVVASFGKIIPLIIIDIPGGELLDVRCDLFAILIIIAFGVGDAFREGSDFLQHLAHL
jgi:hypothetical protein